MPGPYSHLADILQRAEQRLLLRLNRVALRLQRRRSSLGCCCCLSRGTGLLLLQQQKSCAEVSKRKPTR